MWMDISYVSSTFLALANSTYFAELALANSTYFAELALANSALALDHFKYICVH